MTAKPLAEETDAPRCTQPAKPLAEETDAPQCTQPAKPLAEETDAPQCTQPAKPPAARIDAPQETPAMRLPNPAIALLAGLLAAGGIIAAQDAALAQEVDRRRPSQTDTNRRTPAPAPPRQYPRVEYEADLRGFVFMGGLTNKGGRPANPYGEHPGWRIGDPGVIYDHLNLGLERTILRQPVGPGTIGWVLFSSWHPLSDAQRLDFAAGVRQWLGEDHRRRVGVFFGRDATNAFVRRDVGIPEGPLIPLDPTDPQALLWWRQNTDPLLAIGVTEFWLDRGSCNDRPESRSGIIQLARRVRVLQGAKVGVEAIPYAVGPDGRPDWRLGPDWDFLTKVPGMGRWRFLYNIWISRGLRDLLVVPAELRGSIEVHAFLTTHDDPPPTQADADWLEEAGWTISWLNSIQDLDDGPISE